REGIGLPAAGGPARSPTRKVHFQRFRPRTSRRGAGPGCAPRGSRAPGRSPGPQAAPPTAPKEFVVSPREGLACLRVLVGLLGAASPGRAQLFPTGPSAPVVAPAGFSPNVRVQSPTRLDWAFVIPTKNPALLAAALQGYDSRQQTYQLFVPPGARPGQ